MLDRLSTEPWSSNRLSRLIKTPKLHFLDSGILAGLREDEEQTLREEAWWIEIDEELYDAELSYLHKDIYRGDDAEPLSVRLTAQDRFR